MSADLKECPFCGGSACLDQADDGKHYVACSACHGSMGEMSGTWCGEGSAEFDSEADAVQAWNTRAIAPPVAAGSVDTIRTMIGTYRHLPKIHSDEAWDARQAYMDAIMNSIAAWGAQQREAGRKEGKASNETLLRASVNEMDAMERERDEARQRAEKAEAELAAMKEFVSRFWTGQYFDGVTKGDAEEINEALK